MSRATGDAPPAGRRIEIRSGGVRAVVSEVGAGLAGLEAGGRSWLDTYPPDGFPGSGSYGQVLLPWPNRVAGGTYTFGGVAHQLPVDEVAAGNAIHGLTRWMNWRVTRRERSRVVLSLVLHARPGYPFVVAFEVEYAIRGRALRVRDTARNAGSVAAPVGAGHHPYFTLGTDTVDACSLRVPAGACFRTDARGIPVPPPVAVAGTPFDFRSARPIGATVMDTGFAELIRDPDGLARVRLAAPGGSPGIVVALGASFDFLYVFTGDTLADPAARRRSLAVEPYTCAADAFNNGHGLRVLQPGQSFSAEFTIGLTP